jgi:carboxyl-terminal processing protease
MKGDIAYVQLYEFTGTAGDLFRDNVVKKLPPNTKGMVLDLRDDPGGYLEVAVDIAGWFVDRNTVVVREEGRGDNNQEYRSTGNGALKNLPVVVLVNKGSASASEILAGSLRDNRGVKLVGETSFGKGTVQEVTDLPGGGSVKLTVAHWVLPKGQILEGTGLKPDYAVQLPDNFKPGDADPQLQKALDLLK